MTRSARMRRGGVLSLLLVLLAGSAVLRLSGEVDMARAFELVDDAPQEEEASGNVPPAALVEALQRRETRLAEREEALRDREQALAVAETQIDTMMRALQQAEDSLTETLAVADEASEQDLASLTAVYENMAAGEAAALFEQMAPEFAAGFLARMQPEAAAGVMANLPAQTAHEVSVVLAGRNARVPTN